MKAHTIAAAACAAALTAFTGWLALDTFVLPSVYDADAGELNLSMFDEESAQSIAQSSQTETGTGKSAGSRGHRSPGRQRSESETDSDTGTTDSADTAVSSAQSYQDANMRISLTTHEVAGTAVYVADVQLSSAQYLKSAFADDTYGRHITETTSEIAAAHNAILAVNGDYYGTQESGYVIRNGVVYRDSSDGSDLLCVYADGTMQIVSSDAYTAEELVAQGVWQAYCFGPALLENGEIAVSANEEVGRAMASNPRTALGMIDSLHYVFVVSDGRTDESEGLSLSELAAFMQSLGVRTAYNLDGGGSSTMYFQGEVVNNPTTNGKQIREREVSDIVYIG